MADQPNTGQEKSIVVGTWMSRLLTARWGADVPGFAQCTFLSCVRQTFLLLGFRTGNKTDEDTSSN
ncbi:hypothetical protein CHS0354_017512, partial [Potamilus streckersoni]